MAEKDVTAEQVRSLLHYDPETGIFTRLVTTSNRAMAGSVSGSNAGHGYLKIGIAGTQYYAHRVAWLYVHGRWPTKHIDHINGSRSDNRIANLREAEHWENHQNQKPRRTNSTGFTGVSFLKKLSKFEAYIGLHGKKINLGYYDDPVEAHAAYVAAKRKYHTFNPELRRA